LAGWRASLAPETPHPGHATAIDGNPAQTSLLVTQGCTAYPIHMDRTSDSNHSGHIPPHPSSLVSVPEVKENPLRARVQQPSFRYHGRIMIGETNVIEKNEGNVKWQLSIIDASRHFTSPGMRKATHSRVAFLVYVSFDTITEVMIVPERCHPRCIDPRTSLEISEEARLGLLQRLSPYYGTERRRSGPPVERPGL
jgi:hypothetical protein